MPVSSVLNYSVFKFITFFFFNDSFFGMCLNPLIMSFSIPSLECSRFSLRCNLKLKRSLEKQSTPEDVVWAHH